MITFDNDFLDTAAVLKVLTYLLKKVALHVSFAMHTVYLDSKNNVTHCSNSQKKGL